MSVYLEAGRAGLEWLLDPESPELRRLSTEAEARQPETPCDAESLARDSEPLGRLLRDRHFGVATGLVEPPDEVLVAWQRRLAARPATWGAAVTELQFDLRAALGDEHVRLLGAPRWRDERAEEEEPGPAVEEAVAAGVLILRVRRLIGDREDEERLAGWRSDADRHFSHDRIVVDLRGNAGGNDGHTYEWARRRFRAVARHVRESIWMVGGQPLGTWNAFAWRAARNGTSVPPHLVSGKHEPEPDDRIELRHTEYPFEAGDRPWNGNMLVIVDRRTRSSGESSAWMLHDGLGARLIGSPTTGMIEYGNIVPYVLPDSGLVIHLPTKRNDYGFPVESVGFPVEAPLGDDVTAAEVAAEFDAFA